MFRKPAAPVYCFWISCIGLLGCTFRDGGQDLAGFQGLQQPVEAVRSNRRDGQVPVPGPHGSPLPVLECTVNTLVSCCGS